MMVDAVVVIIIRWRLVSYSHSSHARYISAFLLMVPDKLKVTDCYIFLS